MSKTSANLSHELLAAMTKAAPALASMSEIQAATRPGLTSSWSPKEELGHLIDSATNNRVRFVNAALSDAFTGPGYDGEGWVTLAGYDSLAWNSIFSLWLAENTALATLIGRIPDEKLTVPCQIGSEPEMPLGLLIDSYIEHMQHHLDHILKRSPASSLPPGNQ
jgi:hypothetical protein